MQQIHKEMLAVFAERLPRFNQEVLTEFIQRETETLIHGDFHGGNHRFGVDQNEGQVVVYDFQSCGYGLASFEVTDVLEWIEIENYKEVEDIITGIFGPHKICFSGFEKYKNGLLSSNTFIPSDQTS